MSAQGTAATSLLTSPIIQVETPDGEVIACDLPKVLAMLLTQDDPIRSFPGLAAEQRSHWHRFLVRCAAKVLHEAGGAVESARGADLLAYSAVIGGTLAALTDGPEAWQLSSTTWAEPAFLQLPLSSDGDPDEAGYLSRPISLLTALIGSKEFERKSEAVRDMAPIEVVYSLVEYQGGVIFGGRGNYETLLTPSRSGKGSGVPFMGLSFGEGSGVGFRWDVGAFMADRARIARQSGLTGNVWALWTLPWNGRDSLSAMELDPAFVPLARAVRVMSPNDRGRFDSIWFKPSKASRVADHTGGAMLGDPFCPTIESAKQDAGRKVRGVMEGGFDYAEVAELFGLGTRCAPSPSVSAYFEAGTDSRSDVSVRFEGVAFEQGKTLGFYHREVPLPAVVTATNLFSEPDPLREAHTFMLEGLRSAKTILRSATRLALTGEPKPKPGDEGVVEMGPLLLDSWADLDDTYLAFLFSAGRRGMAGDAGYEQEWLDIVSSRAEEVFEVTMRRLPLPNARRFRRHVEARSYLNMRLWDFRGRPDESNDRAERARAEPPPETEEPA